MIIDDKELHAIFAIAEGRETLDKCDCCLWRTLDMKEDKCGDCVHRNNWKMAHTGYTTFFIKHIWQLGSTKEQLECEKHVRKGRIKWRKENYPFYM